MGKISGYGHDMVQNRLLRALPSAALGRLRLEWMPLPFKTVLLVPDMPVDGVYFIEAGIVSMIARMEDGTQSEVGLVGPEGMAGLPVLFGAPTSPLEGLVQVEGAALWMPAAALRAALVEVPALAVLLLRYADAFHVQVSQTAACNSRHAIEQRLARWLLMAHDRVGGDDFPMTQEFLSHMLGVQRPGVTLAVGALQRAGLMSHGGGRLRVLDRAGLEAAACECYGIVRRRFAWLTGPPAIRDNSLDVPASFAIEPTGLVRTV